AAGLFMAADLSVRLGWLGEDELKRIESLLRQAGLPVRCPLPINRMLRLMAVDKKALDGALRLVLLEKIGQAVVGGDYDKGCLRHTLAACRAEPLPA
ncbi:MAG: 3-dehydroquinate synthase family protein, partial [Gammaproteobacteria bacterium]